VYTLYPWTYSTQLGCSLLSKYDSFYETIITCEKDYWFVKCEGTVELLPGKTYSAARYDYNNDKIIFRNDGDNSLQINCIKVPIKRGSVTNPLGL